MAKDYTKYNAKNVLTVVNGYIAVLEKRNEERRPWEGRPVLKIEEVCDELSIFDWWNENLSLTQLKDMKKFLEEAIKLGYTGYVCFKVGAKYCANGMWANKVPTTNGFSPKGEFLYKSFTPDYNYWSAHDDNGIAITEKLGKEYDELKTIRALEKALLEV